MPTPTLPNLDIRTARKKAGLTQVQLAELAGVQQRTLSYHELRQVPVRRRARAYEAIISALESRTAGA